MKEPIFNADGRRRLMGLPTKGYSGEQPQETVYLNLGIVF